MVLSSSFCSTIVSTVALLSIWSSRGRGEYSYITLRALILLSLSYINLPMLFLFSAGVLNK